MADERGAVVALVAVMLLAILGMVALVIDVGGVLVTKRQLVAAADSASLAAAQSCAKEESDFTSKANEYAASNLNGTTGSVTPTGCEAPELGGTVAVTYNANQELYFAPFLPGVDDVVVVEASAVATWGPALKTEPLPVVLNLNDPRSCSPSCALWLDPSVAGGFAEGDEAGLADLDRWGGGGCRRSSSRLFSWISGARSVEVSLPATPCALTSGGNTQALVNALLGQSGRDKVFPVANGFTGGRRGGRFSVVGFAPLRIEDAVRGVEPGAGVCADQPENHSFLGPGDTHSIDNEVLACKLHNLADTVTVRLRRGGSCCSQPADYVFDPATNVIAWNTEETENVRIRISWSKLPDSGGCGVRDVTGNEICLLVSWQGPRVAGSNPAEDGANDYGVRAVRLKD